MYISSRIFINSSHSTWFYDNHKYHKFKYRRPTILNMKPTWKVTLPLDKDALSGSKVTGNSQNTHTIVKLLHFYNKYYLGKLLL